MLKSLFAVYDAKAQAFMTPFVDQTPETAQRSFEVLVNQADTVFYKWPEDYTLFHIGDYDHDTGTIEPISPPLGVCAAATLKRPTGPSLDQFHLSAPPRPTDEVVDQVADGMEVK